MEEVHALMQRAFIASTLKMVAAVCGPCNSPAPKVDSGTALDVGRREPGLEIAFLADENTRLWSSNWQSNQGYVRKG